MISKHNQQKKTSLLYKILTPVLILLYFVACSSPGPETIELPTRNNEPDQSITLSGLEQIKTKGAITIGTAITKPFEYYDPESDILIGLDVDIAEYIANNMGVNIQWIEIPFANLLPALEEGKIDMAIAGIYITPERMEMVNFSTPYLKTGLIMAVHPDIHPNIHTLDDIEGLNIGVKIGATGEQLADELEEQGMEINITRYQDTMDSLLDLEVGRIDIVFNDYLNTLFYIKEYDSTIQIVKNQNDETIFLSNASLGIAVNKQDAELLEEINRILGEMELNGDIENYYTKWLLAENQP